MKLASVTFKRTVTVPGAGSSAEFAANEVDLLEYDRATDMVRIGPIDIPRTDVAEWKRERAKDTDKQTCPDCARQFNNKQGLASHRGFKHPKETAA